MKKVIEQIRSLAKPFFLIVMISAALMIVWIVGYYTNKIANNYVNQKSVKTEDNVSVAVNEKNQLILIDKITGEYQIYSDSVGLNILNVYAKTMVSPVK
jgi:hypothetical protein